RSMKHAIRIMTACGGIALVALMMLVPSVAGGVTRSQATQSVSPQYIEQCGQDQIPLGPGWQTVYIWYPYMPESNVTSGWVTGDSMAFSYSYSFYGGVPNSIAIYVLNPWWFDTYDTFSYCYTFEL